MRYLILCVCISFLFSCNNRKKQDPFDAYMKSLLEHVGKLEEQTQEAFIDDQLVFYGSDSLKTAFLSSLPLENILFFYFSEQTCIPCINQTIEVISEYFPDYIHDENIIFISPDFPSRLRDDCYGKKLLTFYLGTIGLSIENSNVPFFFTVNKEMEISSIHIVIKEEMERTASFLKLFADSHIRPTTSLR